MVRGRKKDSEEMDVISFRLESALKHVIDDIAKLETMATGKPVYSQKLMREALHYVFSDNERMRDCFRRTRVSNTRKFIQRA